MKTLRYVLFAALLTGLAAVPAAQAAVVTWQTPVTISGNDTDVVTTGKLDRAYSYFGPGTAINGVTFAWLCSRNPPAEQIWSTQKSIVQVTLTALFKIFCPSSLMMGFGEYCIRYALL